MNQGRIWCVVNPTVGLPALLGSVTIIALLVHASVLSHTNWFGNYWSGNAKKPAESSENLKPGIAPAAFAISVSPVQNAGGQQTAFVVTVTPNGAKAPVQTTKVALAGH